MPFTFAHPAAVLPLKRFCPAWLSFPALVLGSATPDLAYLSASRRIDEIAHNWTGIFLFSLPVGVVTAWLLHRLGRLMVPAVPEPFRRILLPVVEQPLGALLTVAFSVILGAATHVLWDSFTHKEGWAVQHFAILNQPLGVLVKPGAKVCHVLWYLSTFAGVTCLALSYQKWRGTANGKPRAASSPVKWFNALCLAVLMIPVVLVHHLDHSLRGTTISVVLSLVLVAAFMVWVEKYLISAVKADVASSKVPFVSSP